MGWNWLTRLLARCTQFMQSLNQHAHQTIGHRCIPGLDDETEDPHQVIPAVICSQLGLCREDLPPNPPTWRWHGDLGLDSSNTIQAVDRAGVLIAVEEYYGDLGYVIDYEDYPDEAADIGSLIQFTRSKIRPPLATSRSTVPSTTGF